MTKAEEPRKRYATVEEGASTVDLADEDAVRAAIVRVLRAEGGEPGHSLHSWRCEYPETYGLCTCLEEVADEILLAVRPATGDSDA